MFLGVPFNIASYSLLTSLLAQVCGYKLGEFIHVIGDAHIYLNHIEQIKIQINRQPFLVAIRVTCFINPGFGHGAKRRRHNQYRRQRQPARHQPEYLWGRACDDGATERSEQPTQPQRRQ